MKISLSPPSSASSSSSSSSCSSVAFDRTLCSSQNATSGCLSGVLRRLFCAGNLRTHPFDCMKEANNNKLNSENQKDLKSEEKMEVAGTPGLVARLMGLESMPDLNLVPTCRTMDTIGRSRSVNSADYWSEFDPTQFQHRRIKSTLSFREMPTFLQKENDEFLVLSFEKAGETKEFVSKGKKSEIGCGELKQNRRDQRVLALKNKEDQRSKQRNQNKNDHSEICNGNSCRFEVKDSSSVPACKKNNFGVSKTKSPLKAKNQKDLKSDAAKFEMKKNNKKKSVESPEKTVEPVCVSENSSPVSVLDLDNFLNKTETLASDENSSRASSNSRRDLSPKLAKFDNPLSSFELASVSSEVVQESRVKKKQDLEVKKTESRDDRQLEMWGEEGCKLAEEETNESIWMGRDTRRLGEFDEIGMEFVVHILDKLVNEVSIELVGFPMNKFVM